MVGENKNDDGFETTIQPDAPRRSSRLRKAVDGYGAVPYTLLSSCVCFFILRERIS